MHQRSQYDTSTNLLTQIELMPVKIVKHSIISVSYSFTLCSSCFFFSIILCGQYIDVLIEMWVDAMEVLHQSSLIIVNFVFMLVQWENDIICFWCIMCIYLFMTFLLMVSPLHFTNKCLYMYVTLLHIRNTYYNIHRIHRTIEKCCFCIQSHNKNTKIHFIHLRSDRCLLSFFQ